MLTYDTIAVMNYTEMEAKVAGTLPIPYAEHSPRLPGTGSHQQRAVGGIFDPHARNCQWDVQLVSSMLEGI